MRVGCFVRCVRAYIDKLGAVVDSRKRVREQRRTAVFASLLFTFYATVAAMKTVSAPPRRMQRRAICTLHSGCSCSISLAAVLEINAESLLKLADTGWARLLKSRALRSEFSRDSNSILDGNAKSYSTSKGTTESMRSTAAIDVTIVCATRSSSRCW